MKRLAWFLSLASVFVCAVVLAQPSFGPGTSDTQAIQQLNMALQQMANRMLPQLISGPWTFAAPITIPAKAASGLALTSDAVGNASWGVVGANAIPGDYVRADNNSAMPFTYQLQIDEAAPAGWMNLVDTGGGNGATLQFPAWAVGNEAIMLDDPMSASQAYIPVTIGQGSPNNVLIAGNPPTWGSTVTSLTLNTSTLASGSLNFDGTSAKVVLRDASDNTKGFTFNLAGINSATLSKWYVVNTAARSDTFPDLSGTVAYTTATQTLANKTLGGGTVNNTTDNSNTVNAATLQGSTIYPGNTIQTSATVGGFVDSVTTSKKLRLNLSQMSSSVTSDIVPQHTAARHDSLTDDTSLLDGMIYQQLHTLTTSLGTATTGDVTAISSAHVGWYRLDWYATCTAFTANVAATGTTRVQFSDDTNAQVNMGLDVFATWSAFAGTGSTGPPEQGEVEFYVAKPATPIIYKFTVGSSTMTVALRVAIEAL